MAGLAPAVPPLAGLVLALGLLAATRGLDDLAREGQLGPGFWPRLVLVGLALVCVLRLVAAWRAGTRGLATRVEGGPPAGGRVAAAIGLILLYVAATPFGGFSLATAAFIAAFMTVAGARLGAGTAITAVVGTVALLYVFIKLVYLPLPKGDGPFEVVTLALYRALGIF